MLWCRGVYLNPFFPKFILRMAGMYIFILRILKLHPCGSILSIWTIHKPFQPTLKSLSLYHTIWLSLFCIWSFFGPLITFFVNLCAVFWTIWGYLGPFCMPILAHCPLCYIVIISSGPFVYIYLSPFWQVEHFCVFYLFFGHYQWPIVLSFDPFEPISAHLDWFEPILTN